MGIENCKTFAQLFSWLKKTLVLCSVVSSVSLLTEKVDAQCSKDTATQPRSPLKTSEFWTGTFVLKGRDEKYSLHLSEGKAVYEYFSFSASTSVTAKSISFKDGTIFIDWGNDQQNIHAIMSGRIANTYVQIMLGPTKAIVPYGEVHAVCVLARERPKQIELHVLAHTGKEISFNESDVVVPSDYVAICRYPKLDLLIKEATAPKQVTNVMGYNILKQEITIKGGQRDGLSVGMQLEAPGGAKLTITEVDDQESTAEAVYLVRQGALLRLFRNRQRVSTPITCSVWILDSSPEEDPSPDKPEE